jgi:vacuolar-type H+-ATPase subunit F/Vma7
VTRIVYIGDEATAAGYRLAGVDPRVPAAADALEVFRRALGEDTDLVLLSAELASGLPRAELTGALLGARPLIAIVPDVHDRSAPPDVAREVRFALGIEP